MKSVIIGSAVMVAVCSAAYGDAEQEFLWTEQGKEAVLAKLRDPESAQFRQVYFHRGADDVPVTCGEVNAANAFGGMRGFQRFVSAGKPDLTWLEEEIADFHNVWVRFCL